MASVFSPRPVAFQAALLIPARDEAATIGAVLASLPAACLAQVIVIDNGSHDTTAALARAAGAEVVTEPRHGYGRACLTGLAHLRPEIDAVVFMDADGSDNPADAIRLLTTLGDCELAIGSRVRRALPGALTLHQRWGNWLATWLLRRRWGVESTDLGPFRAIRRQALDRLGMRDQDYGWTIEMQARAARLGMRCREIDVDYRPRRAGRSKVSGTLSGSLRAAAKILATFARLAW